MKKDSVYLRSQPRRRNNCSRAKCSLRRQLHRSWASPCESSARELYPSRQSESWSGHRWTTVLSLRSQPNDSYAADVLVSSFAHALKGLLINPLGNGWYDRYGFENTDKCQDGLGHPAFGQTYLTANGRRANVRFGAATFFIQQNWVNHRRARCAMFR